MKPSLITLLTACLVRPLLARLTRLAGLHMDNLVLAIHEWRLRRAKARMAKARQLMTMECEYHDEHLLELDAQLTHYESRLHELRMQERVLLVKRQHRIGSLS